MMGNKRNAYIRFGMLTILATVYAYIFYLIGEVDMVLFSSLIIQVVFIWWFGRKYEMVKREAERDALTKVYNRRFIVNNFAKIKAKAKRKSQTITIFFIDIDKFKTINDHYGHSTGDIILKKTADILSKGFEKKHYIARWGGDEFIVLMLSDGSSGMKIMQRYFADKLASLSKELKINVTFSVGFEVYSDKNRNLTDILDAADRKMYRHKNKKIPAAK